FFVYFFFILSLFFLFSFSFFFFFSLSFLIFFFFINSAPTEIYTLSLHDALPIFIGSTRYHDIIAAADRVEIGYTWYAKRWQRSRSEEHTSELQSLAYLVCRLLLEKKKKKKKQQNNKKNKKKQKKKNKQKKNKKST